MKTVGVICEYNPFHRGHQRQFEKIRRAWGEDTAIVCLMSGNFVQRGEPALYPKGVRAEAAVRGGADLVLELPVTYALRSAEGFADGGVEILSGLGICGGLSFGCESVEGLMETAQLLLSPAFSPALRKHLDTGISFAAARQRALEDLGGDGSAVSAPNNILAVEYCKAILRRGSALEPLPVLREGSYHDLAPDPEHPSAAALRAAADFLPYVPAETRCCYENRPQYRLRYGERAMLARLRTLPEEEFSHVPFGSEGLWRKVRRACLDGGSIEEILAASKSKRYAMSRLMRLLLCACLGISAERLMQSAPHVRILAFDGRGRALLREAESAIPLIHIGERSPCPEFSELERRCDLLYDLFCEDPAGEYRRLRREAKVFYQEKL